MATAGRRRKRDFLLSVVANPSVSVIALVFAFLALASCHWPGRKGAAPVALVPRSSVWAAPTMGSAPSSSALRAGTPPARPPQYIISSILYFGRISNIKISLIELMGMAAETRRHLVVPEISECAVDGYDRTFGGLFDTSLPLTSGILSVGSFDMLTACNGSAVYVHLGPFNMESDASRGNGRAHFRGLDMDVIAAEDLRIATGGGSRGGSGASFQGFLSIPDQQAGPVHARYFAPGQVDFTGTYQKEPLLLEKLSHRTETCIVLGKQFNALNWERFPETFVRTVRNLAPAPHIRASALAFLRARGLAGGASGCPRGVPSAADDMRPEDLSRILGGGVTGGGKGFSTWGTRGGAGGSGGAAGATAGGVGVGGGVDDDTDGEGGVHFLGVHLRMGDFLTDGAHMSFGGSCNNEPSLLITAVEAAMKAYPHVKRIVVATDDFSSPCYKALADHFGEDPVHAPIAALAAVADGKAASSMHTAGRAGGIVIPVHGGSPFRSSTCSAGLFDQEVLGMSAAFLGDERSSFSEAIHRIRTIRCGSPIDSTIWLYKK